MASDHPLAFDAATTAVLDAFLAAIDTPTKAFDIADHRRNEGDGEILCVSYCPDPSDSLQFEVLLRRAGTDFEWAWRIFPRADLGPEAKSFPGEDFGVRSASDIALIINTVAGAPTPATLYLWLGGLHTCVTMSIMTADGRALYSQGCRWTALATARQLIFAPWQLPASGLETNPHPRT